MFNRFIQWFAYVTRDDRSKTLNESEEDEMNPYQHCLDQHCDFFFNIEDINVFSLEYITDINIIEVGFIVNGEASSVYSYCSHETYEQHLHRLQKKLKLIK